MMADFYGTLAERYPDGNYSEDELWEVIADVHELAMEEIMDGDLTEWL
jgi:hypothetical protein